MPNLPLTCRACRNSPATHLIVADLGGRSRRLLMAKPGRRNPGRTFQDQIALLIRQGALKGIAAEATAVAIVRMVTEEASVRCRDKDCVRIFPHSRLAWHLKRHKAEPPFDHVLRGWLCGSCGFRRGHRIHKTDVSEGA